MTQASAVTVPSSRGRVPVLVVVTAVVLAAYATAAVIPYVTGEFPRPGVLYAAGVLLIVGPFALVGVIASAAVGLRTRWPRREPAAPLVVLVVTASLTLAVMLAPVGPSLVWLVD